MDSIFLKAINKEKTKRPAVWFMRQAGRILPSYLKLREKYSFRDLMNEPILASQVTRLPINDLGVDAAILFSDILVIPESLGMNVKFLNSGPKFDKTLEIEKFDEDRVIWLKEKIFSDGVWTQPLKIEHKHHLILDGHHRYAVAKRLDLARVPAVCIDYLKDDTVEPELWPASSLDSITKQDVIDMALSAKLFPPKTTRHRISDYLPPIHASLRRLSLLTPSQPDAIVS